MKTVEFSVLISGKGDTAEKDLIDALEKVMFQLKEGDIHWEAIVDDMTVQKYQNKKLDKDVEV